MALFQQVLFGVCTGLIGMFKVLFFRQLLWCFFALALLIFALGISWQVNKSMNFSYGFWYQTLDIHSVIAKHVPENTQGKRDFPVNNAELHEQKFADIVQAIHQHGEGLTDIRYVNSQGLSQALLTVSEIQHLQDVANLLDSLVDVWWGNLLFLCVLLVSYLRQRKHNRFTSISVMPTGKQKIIALACLVSLVILMLATWGFTQVFYYLHTVVFPADHQWFFYYNDSLMASLMKAPDIFAAIAMQIVVVALLIASGLDAALSRYQKRN
ncbi:MAG: DUF1461 domain-containing protein [Cognaticolwellia sp.]